MNIADYVARYRQERIKVLLVRDLGDDVEGAMCSRLSDLEEKYIMGRNTADN